jgi:hypothetical protein
MINTQLETIVELVMNAYKNTHSTSIEYVKFFELELRRNLMQKYCDGSNQKTTHTYTINPGTLTGDWTTRQYPAPTSTGTIPAPTSTGTILHG